VYLYVCLSLSPFAFSLVFYPNPEVVSHTSATPASFPLLFPQNAPWTFTVLWLGLAALVGLLVKRQRAAASSSSFLPSSSSSPYNSNRRAFAPPSPYEHRRGPGEGRGGGLFAAPLTYSPLHSSSASGTSARRQYGGGEEGAGGGRVVHRMDV